MKERAVKTDFPKWDWKQLILRMKEAKQWKLNFHQGKYRKDLSSSSLILMSKNMIWKKWITWNLIKRKLEN